MVMHHIYIYIYKFCMLCFDRDLRPKEIHQGFFSIALALKNPNHNAAGPERL